MLDAVYDTTDWELVKYSDRTDEYVIVNPAFVTYKTDGGVTVIEYQITDGGPLDDDGEVNGIIIDPIWPPLFQRKMKKTPLALLAAAAPLVVAAAAHPLAAALQAAQAAAHQVAAVLFR